MDRAKEMPERLWSYPSGTRLTARLITTRHHAHAPQTTEYIRADVHQELRLLAEAVCRLTPVGRVLDDRQKAINNLRDFLSRTEAPKNG